MIRFAFPAILASLALAIMPSTLGAQPVEFELASDKDWEHQWTDMRFPAEFDDFSRLSIYQFQDRETDISANYQGPLGDVLSIYIYRPGLADASIWHDRALVALGGNASFQDPGVKGKRTATFTPTGGASESGIMTVLATEGRFRSTSVALFSSGEWLVKLRLSSIRLEPEGMESRFREILQQLPKMEALSAQKAYLIEPCLDEISYSTAERFEPAEQDALGANSPMLSLTAGLASMAQQNEQAPAAQYCREGNGGREGSIYRTAGIRDNYLIAYGDSGTSVSVAPALSLDAVLASDDPEAAKRAHFLVVHKTAIEHRIFMPFKSLPQPNQASQAVFREAPIATLSRALGDEPAELQVSSAGPAN